MMDEVDDVNLWALCHAFVNQDSNSGNHCTVDKVLVAGAEIHIHYSWPRGSSEWYTNQLELFAWAWNNPKKTDL